MERKSAEAKTKTTEKIAAEIVEEKESAKTNKAGRINCDERAMKKKFGSLG